jgi:hypothetical protein
MLLPRHSRLQEGICGAQSRKTRKIGADEEGGEEVIFANKLLALNLNERGR